VLSGGSGPFFSHGVWNAGGYLNHAYFQPDKIGQMVNMDD
jgi:hypothetical protein